MLHGVFKLDLVVFQLKTNIMRLIVTINEGLTPVTISKRASFVQGYECDGKNMAKLTLGLQESALDQVI